MPLHPPPKEFTPPAYVSAFMITALLLIILGVVMVVQAINEGHIPYAAVGCFVAALVNYLYGEIAKDVARSAWQSARLTYELGPVMDEINLQAKDRAKSERAARQQKEAEIREKLAFEEKNSAIYFIDTGARTLGPFSLVQLGDLYAKGSIDLKSVTRDEGGVLGPTVKELLFPED